MAATQHHFLDDDDPPAYTPLPGAHEESLDAGAGTPIVRAQAAHLVINPSDPRSNYTRSYRASPGSSPVPHLPRRGNANSGPVPMNPRLPSRLNAGYERMGPAPHLSPRIRVSLPLMQHATSQQRAEPSFVSYLTMRDNPTSVRVVNGLPLSPGGHRNNGSGSQAAVYTTECPACHNSGWLNYKVPCSCPAGSFVKNNHPRFHSSLLRFVDDILGPPSHTNIACYSNPSVPSHQSTQNSNNSRQPTYLQHLPGRGSPCPNCMGQSYFRNPNVRDSPAARDVRARLGHTPPPCDVCADRGRIE